jgi:hypothetical protein
MEYFVGAGYRMARSPDKDAGLIGCQNAPAAAGQEKAVRAVQEFDFGRHASGRECSGHQLCLWVDNVRYATYVTFSRVHLTGDLFGV